MLKQEVIILNIKSTFPGNRKQVEFLILRTSYEFILSTYVSTFDFLPLFPKLDGLTVIEFSKVR